MGDKRKKWVVIEENGGGGRDAFTAEHEQSFLYETKLEEFYNVNLLYRYLIKLASKFRFEQWILLWLCMES